jgi:shikimate kinase
MKKNALTVWLKAPAGILLSRVKKRDTRPLLQGDSKEIIEKLLAVREPVYAQADITLECADESHNSAVDRILAALRERGLET